MAIFGCFPCNQRVTASIAQQLGQDFARFPDQGEIDVARNRAGLDVDLDDFGTGASGNRNQARRGIDNRGGPDDQQEIRFRHGLFCAIPCRRRQALAEPDYPWSCQISAAALAVLCTVKFVVCPLGAARHAPQGPDTAVQFEYSFASCPLMESVNVLRDQSEMRNSSL